MNERYEWYSCNLSIVTDMIGILALRARTLRTQIAQNWVILIPALVFTLHALSILLISSTEGCSLLRNRIFDALKIWSSVRYPSHSSSNRARITDSISILDLFSNGLVGDVDLRFQALVGVCFFSSPWSPPKPRKNPCILDFLLSLGGLYLGFLCGKRFDSSFSN